MTKIGNITLKKDVTSEFFNGTACYLSIITIGSILFNAWSCFVLLARFPCWKPQMRILFSLMMGDAIAPMVAYPLAVHSNAVGEWRLGVRACTFYAFVTSVGGIGSIYHLVLLSAERYLAIVHPFLYDEFTNVKIVTRCLIAAWFMAAVTSAFPIIGWSSYEFEGVGTSCSFNMFAESWTDKSFSIYLIFVAFIVPLTCIVLLNLGFLKVVFKLAQCPCLKDSRQSGSQHSVVCQVGKDRQLANQMCILVTVLILSFLFTWLPYAVVSVIGVIGELPRENTMAVSIPAYFAKSYTIYDPIIYFFLEKRFRKAVKRSCCGNARTDIEDSLPSGLPTFVVKETSNQDDGIERTQAQATSQVANPIEEEVLSFNAMIALG